MTSRERFAKGNIKRYQDSNLYSLYHAYERFSRKKEEAFEYCRKLMVENNGYGLKIISFNTFMFTAGFIFEDNGTEKFMFITPSYDTVVDYI